MDIPKIFESEYRFCLILWENEPVNSTKLAQLSKEEAQASRLEEMVEETFEGSLPAFIAAFSRTKKLTRQEVEQLKALINDYKED